jgi:hypothetical protein
MTHPATSQPTVIPCATWHRVPTESNVRPARRPSIM